MTNCLSGKALDQAKIKARRKEDRIKPDRGALRGNIFGDNHLVQALNVCIGLLNFSPDEFLTLVLIQQRQCHVPTHIFIIDIVLRWQVLTSYVVQ